MSLLEIKKLNKSFGEKKAVNNISLNLEKGEILAILGESGSGKTTLLHLIAALKEPDFGTLRLDNQRIIPPSEKLIAGHQDIKLVKQDYGLFPNMTIQENIAYELRFYEENYRVKRVEKLLKLSGLWKIKDHLPKQVSGGEQQRAVIVKAIAEKPKLLLLDEPFSHLDSRNKAKLKNEVLNLIKNEGVSCIFVTHEVSDAFAIADRLAVMKKGKFLQIGGPQEVYNQPISKYVAEMTGVLAVGEEETEKLNQIFSTNHKFIRPEQIIISQSADIQAIVKEIKFFGAFYEIKIELNDLIIKMFTFDSLEINQKIGIKIA